MKYLYLLGISCYGLIIRIMALYHPKARAFILGRKGLFDRLSFVMQKNSKPVIWIHAASLGEFEQGRTIIEELRNQDHQIFILLTFFSPSGYEACKDYKHADYISYLPLDTPKNASRFVSMVHPKMVLFIKYEFWYYYLRVLRASGIPVMVASAVFRSNQWFFHRTGRFLRKELARLEWFFVQDENSITLLKKYGIGHASLTGDSRYDRVVEISENGKDFPILKAFKSDQPLMVLGSIWPSDLGRLQDFIRIHSKTLKFIIAPHELNNSFLKKLYAIPDSIAYSSIPERFPESARVIILDTMGMLSSVYRYADYAYVGGGFKGALHNLLEPAVYGIPVFFGEHTNNQKFIEATEVISAGAGFSFYGIEEFVAKFEHLKNDQQAYQKAGAAAKEFVRARTGATQKIVKKITEKI